MNFLPLAVLSMTDAQPLESRLRAVLDKTVSRTSPTGRTLHIGAFTALLLCALVGTARLTAQTPPAPPPVVTEVEMTTEMKEERQKWNETLTRAKAVATATMMYVQDYDMFPPADRYVRVLTPYLKNKNAFTSGFDVPGTISFKINPNIAGKDMTRMEAPASTVLFYEGTPGKPSFRYGWGDKKYALIAYADGHVKMTMPNALQSVAWTVKAPTKVAPRNASTNEAKAQHESMVKAMESAARRWATYPRQEQQARLRQSIAELQFLQSASQARLKAIQAAERSSRQKRELTSEFLNNQLLQKRIAELQVQAYENSVVRSKKAQVEQSRAAQSRAMVTLQKAMAETRRERELLEIKTRLLETEMETLRRKQKNAKP